MNTEPPIARSTDPLESHQAAEEITADGSRKHWKRRIAHAVERYPNRTRNELCEVTGISVDTMGKRLSDLEHARMITRGPSRRCTVSGRRAATWHPVEVPR